MIGSRTEPSALARIVYVGGPWDGREETLEVPGGVPTILAVDAPLGCYVRDEFLPDGRWLMAWRGFEGGERQRQDAPRSPWMP